MEEIFPHCGKRRLSLIIISDSLEKGRWVTKWGAGATEMGVKSSGQEFGKEASRCGGCLCSDFAGRGVAEVGEDVADERDIGGFGEEFAVFAYEMGGDVVGQGGGQIGRIGFDQEMAVLNLGGVFAGAGVLGAGESAAKRDVHIFGGEGGEGVGRTGVGVDEESGGMGGEGEQDFQHAGPGVAAVEAGGEGEFVGEVELGEEDGFAVGVEVIAHPGVEPDFADAGGTGGEDVAEGLEPVGASVLDEPRVDAEGADHEAGIGIGEAADGGPVGLAGGVDVKEFDAGVTGSCQHMRQVRGQARVLQMAVGVDPDKIFRVWRDGGWYAHG